MKIETLLVAYFEDKEMITATTRTANSRVGLYVLFPLSSTSMMNNAHGTSLFAKYPTTVHPISSTSVETDFHEIRFHTSFTFCQKLGGSTGDSAF
jgi:hypothetical protein